MNDLSNTLVSAATPVIVPDLSAMTMMVRWAVSVPTLRKKDKKATREAEIAAGAKRGKANLTKALLGDCAEFKTLNDYIGNARNQHYRLTLPWYDNGHRIVTTHAMMGHRQEMGGHKIKIEELFEEFLQVYDAAKHAEQDGMGAFWVDAEYPSVEKLRSKFKVHLEYCGLPKNDFRSDLVSEVAQEVIDDHIQGDQERTANAMNHLWTQLYEQLTRFSKQLEVDETGKGNKLYTSTVTRNLELCDMLATFNVTGDRQMEENRQRLERVFSGLTLDGVKNSPSERATKKQELDAAIAALPSLDM